MPAALTAVVLAEGIAEVDDIVPVFVVVLRVVDFRRRCAVCLRLASRACGVILKPESEECRVDGVEET